MTAWFSASRAGTGTQLFKLGNDESGTQWTTDPGFFGSGLTPFDLTLFNDAVWFNGETSTGSTQLFKLGNDGSVTQWTSLGAFFNPFDLTVFNNALWFEGFDTTTNLFQLFKLGAD